VFTDNYITTSAADFKIISVEPDVIVLDDLIGYQHRLKRVNSFAYESAANHAGPPVRDLDANKVDLSGSFLVRNWFAFRRAADPGFVTAEMPLLRYLNIQEKTGENDYKGEVQFAKNGIAFVQPCTISIHEKTMQINTEGASWNMQLYKAYGKELIVGKKGELVYYFTNL
ncbi:MAG TPA: hypothetical protein VKH37_00135, partial [Ferruginibacter sp.]|nr:hypothetical protein [Ferruginibacter sp.]